LNEPTFKYYRNKIRGENEEAVKWLDKIPKEKWTQAYDKGVRWGHMTSNLAESMNNVFKGIRNLPKTALVKSTYYRLASLFAERGENANIRLKTNQAYTEHCMNTLKAEVIKSHTHEVNQFDREMHTFSVRETVDHKEGRPKGTFKVDLHAEWCDCGKFQAFHMPCSHVIAACSSVNHDYRRYIHQVYSSDHVFNVYNTRFEVIQHPSYWIPYEGEILCHDETMRRVKKGRPNSTRIMTEMDAVERNPRKCGMCRETGHSRKNCPLTRQN